MRNLLQSSQSTVLVNIAGAPLTQNETRQSLHLKRVYDELTFALTRTDAFVLRAWGKCSAARLLTLTTRRVAGLARLAGIGHHRSPLTHTIIAGILAEGVLLALVDLAAEMHGRLLHEHDDLWDGLARIGRPFADSASVSQSAGTAWHLLIDAGIQPAPYHDLPFSMPIEAHQAVLVANGAAEGVNAARRVKGLAKSPVDRA
jgi:hypothetical protein